MYRYGKVPEMRCQHICRTRGTGWRRGSIPGLAPGSTGISWLANCTSCLGMVNYLKCLVNTSAEHEELDGGGEVYGTWAGPRKNSQAGPHVFCVGIVKHQYLKCLANTSTEHEELDGGGDIYLGWPQLVRYLGWPQVVYLCWPLCISCIGMVKYLKCLVNTSAEHEELDGGGEVYGTWAGPRKYTWAGPHVFCVGIVKHQYLKCLVNTSTARGTGWRRGYIARLAPGSIPELASMYLLRRHG
jgi:hypothetical protein